ncbi:hypothetical protein WMF27_35075 [Sorangium sp. So ce281]|uniref:hypothetical protein n=1 Tax=unclassified Sorangium TaxID=2621164 RepID=UPI003F6228A7
MYVVQNGRQLADARRADVAREVIQVNLDPAMVFSGGPSAPPSKSWIDRRTIGINDGAQ